MPFLSGVDIVRWASGKIDGGRTRQEKNALSFVEQVMLDPKTAYLTDQFRQDVVEIFHLQLSNVPINEYDGRLSVEDQDLKRVSLIVEECLSFYEDNYDKVLGMKKSLPRVIKQNSWPLKV